jgi:hypothetical protein
VFTGFVLNFSIAMFKGILWILLSLLFTWPFAPVAQQVVVDSPRPGDALQGQVVLTGTTDIEGFQSYEIRFAYMKDDTNTWFFIAKGDQVIRGGPLATWDTTTISDGLYRLRVRVFLKDGRGIETMINNLRVRNYTPIETATPEPVTRESGATAKGPQNADYVPAGLTPTALDDNPIQVTTANLGDSLVRGGLVAMLLFIALGVYLGIRMLFRHK